MMLSIDQIDGRLSGLTFAEAENELGMFNSYERTPALVLVLGRAPTPADIMRVFLDWGHMCDAPWWDRTHIAMYLRRAISEINMADFLELDARAFYDALPPVVSIWRGCERGRERGLSWTTDRAVAEAFASGKRCSNRSPTLAQAEIPKQHIFAVFVSRSENEIVVDPRRLRKFQAHDLGDQCHTQVKPAA
jgi:hypothetical protein